MIQEHEEAWINKTLRETNHYTPVIWKDKILYDGIRRHDANQHIRLDVIDVEGKTVVDLGCNNGYFCFRLIQKGAKYCIGIDSDSKVLKAANIIQRYNEITKVRFYVSDLYIVDKAAIRSDVVLLLSLMPSNWLFTNLTVEKEAKTAFDFLAAFGKEIYIEPTNHHQQNQTSWTKDIKLAKKNVKALGGSLEFLTWTDYQKRPLIKLIPVVN